MKPPEPLNPAKTPRAARIARTLRKQDHWAQELVWRWLRDRHFSTYKFRREHPFGPCFLDFFCIEARVDIELDGSQHGTPEQMSKDRERDANLEARGIKVLRFWNSRLRREKEAVRDTIWRTLQERAPHPLPDYCRPKPVEKNFATQQSTSPSPSPRPSPLGRG